MKGTHTLREARRRGYYVEFSEEDIRVHSPYDPVREARRRLDDVIDPSVKLVLMGAGLGYVLEALRSRVESPRVLVLEPHPELLDKGRGRNLWSREGFGELVILGPEEDAPLDVVGDFLPLRDQTGFELVRWEDYERVAPSFFQRQLERLNRLQTFHMSTVKTLHRSGPTWLKHARVNLRHLPENRFVHPKTLRGRFGVVSAGPSLDDQIGWLRNNRENISLLAGNTIGPSLRKRSIKPDALVAVDADPVVYEDLVHSPRAHMILSPFVDPRVLDRLHGKEGVPFTILGVDTPITRWLTEAPFLNTVEPGGSMTSTLVHWLLEHNAERLYLLGCDMEVSGGRYYARGTRREDRAVQRLNRFNTLPGWHLRKKRTSEEKTAGLEQERNWLLERQKRTDALRIPPPSPSWWRGPEPPEALQPAGTRLETRPVSGDSIRTWCARQRGALADLLRGREVPGVWVDFTEWVSRICDQPEPELEAWLRVFERLENHASRTEV